MKKIIVLLIFLATISAEAVKFQIPVKEGMKIVLSGYQGTVRLVHQPKFKELRLRVQGVEETNTEDAFFSSSDEWKVEKRIVDNEVQFLIEGPSREEPWLKMLKEKKKKVSVLLEGPSVPVDITWWSGNISLQGWQKSSKITLYEGHLKALSTGGMLRFFHSKGRVSVQEHLGPLELESYGGKVHLENIHGDVRVFNYLGKTVAKNLEGKFDFHGAQGNTEVEGGRGQIEFENGRGHLRITKFEGGVEGKTDSGSLRLKTAKEVSVRLRSGTGKVIVDVPPSSGARVNVGTKEGRLGVPPYLTLTRYPNLKIMSGRLQGHESGSIYVRTTEGSVIVR